MTGGRQGLTLALLALVAAGPLATAPGPGISSPHLDCVPAPCNVRVTTTTGPANEVMVAVNPTNANNLIAVAKDYNLGASHPCNVTNVWAGAYTTTDGGLTWSNQLIPPLPGSPTTIFDCSTDPVVAFNAEGTAFFSGLGIEIAEGPPGTVGARSIWVAKSNDGGVTWPVNVIAVQGSGTGGVPPFLDKEWIGVDQSNGKVFLAWNHDLDMVGRSSSTDGLVWGPPLLAPQPPPLDNKIRIGAQPTAGPNNAYYLAWSNLADHDIRSVRSHDSGETLDGQPALVAQYAPLPLSTYRTETLPSLGIDLSGGTRNGWLYLAWHDVREGSPDIFISRSSDGAQTWSTPVKVTDDAPGSNVQFFPAVAVGPNGNVHVAWYDRRNDPANNLLDLYYGVSSDGGSTWSPNLRVTTQSFDPQWSENQAGLKFMGDYIGIAVGSDGVAHPVWTDTRNNRADIYSARVVP